MPLLRRIDVHQDGQKRRTPRISILGMREIPRLHRNCANRLIRLIRPIRLIRLISCLALSAYFLLKPQYLS